ncbi:MAG: hypothetical protein ACLTER_28170, partial [Ruminococcus sp.]
MYLNSLSPYKLPPTEISSVSATKFFINSTWVSIVPLSSVSSVSIEILAYNPARNGLLISVWTVALPTTVGMFSYSFVPFYTTSFTLTCRLLSSSTTVSTP